MWFLPDFIISRRHPRPAVLRGGLVEELTTDNIAEVDGDKWIIGRRHKTMVSTNRPMVSTNRSNIPCQLKLMDVLVSGCFYIGINWNLH